MIGQRGKVLEKCGLAHARNFVMIQCTDFYRQESATRDRGKHMRNVREAGRSGLIGRGCSRQRPAVPLVSEVQARPIRGSIALTAGTLALGWLLCTSPAQALEFGDGAVRGSLDTTLSHGMTFRVADRDESLIGINSDDGDRNYDRGLVSNTSKVTTELELDYGDFGAFARVYGFIDFENENGERERTPLTSEAKDLAGKDLKVLDLYVTGAFDAGDTAVDVRLGSHVLNWGESTFIQNGVNVINPFDVSSLRTPGAELRDALVPVPLVSASVAPTSVLSLEGFYQLDWKETEIDPVGTYFSTNDYAGTGGTRAFIDSDALLPLLVAGGFGPLTPAINADLAGVSQTSQPLHDPAFLSVSRSPDRNPDDSGQFGLALRYFAEDLNDTEFGFYFINHHSRLPLLSARYGTIDGYTSGLAAAAAVSAASSRTRAAITSALPLGTPQSVIDQQVGGVAQALAIDRYGKTARYFVQYPEDLKVFGVSFNTLLGASGWALQGEYSFHPDTPLQRSEESLFEDGLAPLVAQLAQLPGAEQLRALLGTRLQGYIERDVSQLQVTATRVFGPTLGADSLAFVTEAAVTHVHNMPAKEVTPLDTAGIGSELADATSFGYRAAARLDYNNAVGAARLSPFAQLQHDVNGSSPAPSGPFVDGRIVLTLGAGVSYLERWQGSLSYTMHAGKNNNLGDRDFVSASVKYSF